jgi:hypothetical protein
MTEPGRPQHPNHQDTTWSVLLKYVLTCRQSSQTSPSPDTKQTPDSTSDHGSQSMFHLSASKHCHVEPAAQRSGECQIGLTWDRFFRITVELSTAVSCSGAPDQPTSGVT